MTRNQKGFAPILILGLVVVAGVILFIISKNFGVSKLNLAVLSPTPSSSSSLVSPISPVGWKTYINTRDNYSLKYPNSWSIYETPSVSNVIGFSIKENLRADIWVEVLENKKMLTAKKWWIESLKENNDGIDLLSTTEGKETIIDGNKAYSVKSSSSETWGGYRYIWTYVAKGDKIYQIWVGNSGTDIGWDWGDRSRIYEQILSTFKFTQ